MKEHAAPIGDSGTSRTTRFSRASLLVLHGAVTITALAGGAALAMGSIWPNLASGISMPTSYLDGSPFSSFLIPGIVLAVLLGGGHAVAFFAQLRRFRYAAFLSAAAAFAALIWIFVQMVYIPFSVLQAVYFAIGVGEVGFVMLSLGVLTPQSTNRKVLT